MEMELGCSVPGRVTVDYSKSLGSGAYGRVCPAKIGELPCAAKLLLDILYYSEDPGKDHIIRKFRQECQFLRSIKHANIVQFLGTIKDPESQRIVLLLELMDVSLTNFLEQAVDTLPYHTQLNLCHDIALALAYLHSIGIIHRDLSSNNVLLADEGSKVKVTDFGMSKLVDMNPRMTSRTPLTNVPGTPVYMPPEALGNAAVEYSNKLDCFSHGVLAIQIITRNFPKPGDAHKWINIRSSPTGRALIPIPETVRRKKDINLIAPDHPLLPVALACIKEKDTERPSADDICRRLEALKKGSRCLRSVQGSKMECPVSAFAPPPPPPPPPYPTPRPPRPQGT